MKKLLQYLTVLSLSLACSLTLAAGVSSKFYLTNYSSQTLIPEALESTHANREALHQNAKDIKVLDIKDSAMFFQNRSFTHSLALIDQDTGETVCQISESIATYFSFASFRGIPLLNYGPKILDVHVTSNNPRCMVQLYHKTRSTFGGETAFIHVSYYGKNHL